MRGPIHFCRLHQIRSWRAKSDESQTDLPPHVGEHPASPFLRRAGERASPRQGPAVTILVCRLGLLVAHSGGGEVERKGWGEAAAARVSPRATHARAMRD